MTIPATQPPALSGERVGTRAGKRFLRRLFFLAVLIGVGLLYRFADFGVAQPAPAVETDDPLLVNAAHALPSGFVPPELVLLIERVPVADADVAVASEVVAPLERMFRAARKSGLKLLYVASGYRTATEQRRLWDQSEDRSYVQRPGHSEHQTGLAVDLADLKVGDGDFGRSRAGKWLAGNAWRYGFLLRYPEGKESITGISYEPWHYRYVGREVAGRCHLKNWTLEEYVAAL